MDIAASGCACCPAIGKIEPQCYIWTMSCSNGTRALPDVVQHELPRHRILPICTSVLRYVPDTL
jgi:hypothetical protein